MKTAPNITQLINWLGEQGLSIGVHPSGGYDVLVGEAGSLCADEPAPTVDRAIIAAIEYMLLAIKLDTEERMLQAAERAGLLVYPAGEGDTLSWSFFWPCGCAGEGYEDAAAALQAGIVTHVPPSVPMMRVDTRPQRITNTA